MWFDRFGPHERRVISWCLGEINVPLEWSAPSMQVTLELRQMKEETRVVVPLLGLALCEDHFRVLWRIVSQGVRFSRFASQKFISCGYGRTAHFHQSIER